MATVTLTLDEYEALRSLIGSERESEGATLAAAEKKPRKASAYSKRYGKAFKKVSPDFKKMNGDWKKNGFRSAVRAAHKLAKTNRKL